MEWRGKGTLGNEVAKLGKKTTAMCQQYATQSLIAEQWHISVALGRPGLRY